MSNRDHSVLRGIWLNPGRVEASIEHLLLRMLEFSQPNPILRQSVIEELNRRAKRKDVVLEYLGLREVGMDERDGLVLYLASPAQTENPWQDALLSHQDDCPIGFVCNTHDQGRVVVVHEIFLLLKPPQKDLIYSYAALALRGSKHESIVNRLSRSDAGAERYRETVYETRWHLQFIDQSVLYSHDGEVRVQVGSLSQTTKNILREGIKGDYLFILPKYLFEGRTNYADVEFLVYLNFFMRHGTRTRIAGTAAQVEILEKLLNLTIFGLFNPQDTELPSLAELQRVYEVPDQETLSFFTMCHEKYSIRQNADSKSPILGIQDYVDFELLGEEDQPTVIQTRLRDEDNEQAATGTVEVVARADGAFDVCITQADGQVTTKRLAVMPPARTLLPVPEALRQASQFATDRPRFGVMPLGTSHGFDPMGDLTSFVIWINGEGILVDPSPEALGCLDDIGVARADLRYVFLTHVHADHDGGLIEMLLSGSRTTIITSDVVFRTFVEKARLITGHDFPQEGLVGHVTANPGIPAMLEVAGERVTLETRWNLHPIPTNGFKLTIEGTSFGYAGDTQYDPKLIHQLYAEDRLSQQQYHDLLYFFWTPDGRPTVDLLYHEAGVPPIHTDRTQLERLPKAVKAKTFLVHIAERDVLPDSFPGKPPLFVTQTLLPATSQLHDRIMPYSLRLVSYLYDVPTETLEGLAQAATIRVFESDEVIIRKGPMEEGAPINFFVIADGEAVVNDGGWPITKLIKGDSFGEWAISHRRGYRVADVVASRRSQVIELEEATYHWLIARHPVIEERIGRIHALLPRLQLAQARAIQQTTQEPHRAGSVIEEMKSSQLAAFALFSQVKEVAKGMPVVVEAEEVDGFYVLLSGYLRVSIGGKEVGELSEGDVFGEVGLIEGGRRTATIEVVSANAEVLVMSQQNFQALLQHVPAFSFGIRAIAAQRQEGREV